MHVQPGTLAMRRGPLVSGGHKPFMGRRPAPGRQQPAAAHRRTQQAWTGGDMIGPFLSARHTLASAAGLARSVHAYASWTIAQLKHEQPSAEPVACGAGCAWCCYSWVQVTAPELAAVARYLEQHTDGAGLEAFDARVSRLVAQTLGMNATERMGAHLGCGFLVHNRCAIYPVRPLVCRACNSVDASACHAEWIAPGQPGGIPFYLPQYYGVFLIAATVEARLTAAGLDGSGIELMGGMASMWHTPDAVARWWDGEAVFAPAYVTAHMLTKSLPARDALAVGRG